MSEYSKDFVVEKYLLSLLNTEFLFYSEEEWNKEYSEEECNKELESTPSRFFTKHLMQLYWTITRFIGLGFLHESRSRSLIDVYTFVDADGERRVRDFVSWGRDGGNDDIQGRLLIDVTSTFLIGSWTGIQRVTREVAHFAVKRGLGIPVVLHEGGVMKVDIFSGTLWPLDVQAGDDLFLLDSTWMGEMEPVRLAIQTIRDGGGRIVACVHDILPLQYPLLFPKGHASRFSQNFRALAQTVDGFITVSQCVANVMTSYIARELGIAGTSKPILWTHNGSDLFLEKAGSPINNPTLIGLANRVYFICVGTVEPRKGHIVALEAFEQLWNEGLDVALVIIGKPGWMMEAFEDRVAKHIEINKRLFRFSQIDDAQLSYAYKNAQALLMPAVAEGFGLPAIEAASLGLPVIASDIPIMREVGKESFYYFELLNPADLAISVRELLRTDKSERRVLKDICSWEDASARFIANARSVLTIDHPDLSKSAKL